jgi:protein-disulfide isomerase
MRPDASKKIAKATPKSGPNVVIIGAVVAAVVVIAVVVAIVIGNNGKSGSSTASAQTVPVGVVGGTGGGIAVNAAAAKSNAPTLDLYEDFQCPKCGQLEKALGSDIRALADAGQVKLVIHMMSFLDGNLQNDSSTRAANAATCAADSGKLLQYHAAVFAAQPAKEGAGYTDAQLTQFATTAGIAGPALTTWQKCTTSGQHSQYVTDVETASGKAGVTGTPTVKVNGTDVTTLETPDGQWHPEALIAAVKAATN